MTFVPGGYETLRVPEHEETMCDGCGMMMNGSDDVGVGTARPGKPDVYFYSKKRDRIYCEECWLKAIGDLPLDEVGPQMTDKQDDQIVADAIAEDVHNQEIELFSRFCPVCGKDCGESDFEPRDNSVGIPMDQWWNSCEEHGDFTTLTDSRKFTENEDYSG